MQKRNDCILHNVITILKTIMIVRKSPASGSNEFKKNTERQSWVRAPQICVCCERVSGQRGFLLFIFIGWYDFYFFIFFLVSLFYDCKCTCGLTGALWKQINPNGSIVSTFHFILSFKSGCCYFKNFVPFRDF